MTKFKDVAHLYMSVECRDTFNDENIRLTPKMFCGYCGDNFEQIKPFLRRLDSLTDEEKLEMDKSLNLIHPVYSHPHLGVSVWSAQTFTYLLSLHIDLFDLIKNPEAIELKH